MRREELADWFQQQNEPAYRVDQLLAWLHARRAVAWDEMSNLPRRLRSRLAETFRLELPRLVQLQGSPDATRKFLWRLGDGALIECVLIPANPALYGEPSDRHTLCISTQVGCAYGCRFCASGLGGWKRNLRVEEIVGQIAAVERWAAAQPTERLSLPPAAAEEPVDPGGPAVAPARVVNNVVVMGMGEPLANYDNLLRALGILNAPWGGNIGARKITISTSGLAPQIRRLAEEPQQFGLAISLHGATDAVRTRLMPVNRKYPLTALIEAGEQYQRRHGRVITLEYILIAGVNDRMDQVKPLAAIARRLNAKVNLIPYNTVHGLPWSRPAESVQLRFLRALERERTKATLRREKGHEIDAACGQLRLRTERELGGTGVLSSALPRRD